jgi:hypothetical protein
MNRIMLGGAVALLVGSIAFGAECTDCNCKYAGRWALTIPGGGAGWLGVTNMGGKVSGALLWGGGSVDPQEVKIENGKLLVIRRHGHKKDGKDVTWVETMTGRLEGDGIAFHTSTVDETGKEVGKADFSGKRIPELPAAPDLSKVKYGEPIKLLNGKDLAGWELMDKNAFNGWSIQDGALCNRVAALHKHGSNLKTTQTFEDFNLKTEVNMSKNGNSGIYLRGIYEIQMADTYGRPCDSHNMCGLYSRVTPSVAAEKPAGEWQTVDITLVDRHVTVILNGKKVIDNQPILGCTGGAMTSDEFKAGPIYLQGDHSDVSYRNMVITPIVK